MTEPMGPIDEKQLEAYLDGQLDAAAREAFEGQLRHHPEVLKQMDLQNQIDASLQRLFAAGEPTEEHMAALLGALPKHLEVGRPLGGKRELQRILRYAVVGLAAALAWIVVAWQFQPHGVEQPFFEAEPLAQLYREAVSSGFEPYYECNEPARFAATFARRQGQPLQLLAMPDGSGMLGLSYPGGLSPQTTAMLCRVDGRPVMVFVDRLAADKPLAIMHDDPELHVFRKEAYGLVFYEVTPFDTARVMEFLVPSTQGSS